MIVSEGCPTNPGHFPAWHDKNGFFFCTKKVLLKYHPPSLVMFSWWPPVGCALFFNVGISIIYSCLNFLKSCWNEITISQLCYLQCSVHYWLFVFQELGFCVHVKHPHKVHKKLSCQQWYQLLLTTEIEVLFYLSILFYLVFFVSCTSKLCVCLFLFFFFSDKI